MQEEGERGFGHRNAPRRGPTRIRCSGLRLHERCCEFLIDLDQPAAANQGPSQPTLLVAVSIDTIGGGPTREVALPVCADEAEAIVRA